MGSDRWIYTFFIIILTFTVGLQYEKKILKKGDDIELTCEDDVAVHWCYPPKYRHPDDPDGTDYDSKTNEYFPSGSKYKTTLKIEKATYRYTGYYHCIRNDSDTPCNRKMDNVKSTYVFVEDPENPLVVTGFREITAYRNEAATLPCFPTHPNFKIELTRSGHPVQLGKQDKSDLVVTYNETLGFKLEPFTLRDSDYYQCSHKNVELICDVTTKVRVLYLMTPSILKDSKNVKNKTIAREGSSLKLICRSLQNEGLTSVKFVWNIPNQSKKNTEEYNCNYKSYKCRESLLTVDNVTHADAGNYSCIISVGHVNPANATVEVEVIGKDVLGISVSSTWNSSIPIIRGDAPMKIVVEYISTENATVNWYGPDGKAIEMNSNKYVVSTTSSQTILNVNNVSVSDSGPYSVQLVDKTMNFVWFNTSAVIADKPEIQIEAPTLLFSPGKPSRFSCKVYSPAPVDIKWTFTKCNLTEDENCEGNGTQILNKTSIQKFERVYVFNITFKTDEPGVLRCVANNSCGKYCGSSNMSKNVYLTELPEMNRLLSIINKPKEIVAGSALTLSCAGSIYYIQSYPSWEFNNGKINETQILSNSSEISIHTSRTRYTFFSNLTFHNLSRAFHGKNALCFVEDFSDNQYLDIQDPEKPTITQTNLNKDIEVKMSEQVVLYCKTKGVPKPKLTWLKDGDVLKKDNRYKIREYNDSFTIHPVIPEDDGLYSCEAENMVDKIHRKARLIVTDKPGPISVELLATILTLAPILLALIIFLVVKIRKERKLQRELNLAGLANFEKGAMENINPELPVDEQADLLPYDKTWEFPVEKLKLGKMLGAGAFGVVMKAEAYGIQDDEEKTTVAVKMVKSGADRSYIRALASELKIMIHLGKHLNVVNLLGASTKRLNKMELMVIVEYCRFGNIQNYLIRHRDDFVDQVDPNTGEINLAIGMDLLARAHSTKSKTTLKNRLLSYSSSLIGGNNSGGSNTELRTPASPSTTEVTAVASDMSVVSSPNGEPDECLLSNGSGDQPEWRVKYTGDYGDSTINICTQNLLCWAFQIARGMDYLASRKVLHGDLAARNVLLADENIVKICDFGLARSMYRSDNYKKKGGGPLPVKWMALESIRDHIFSTQSDVWSFGIVLWELFSLARTPYPGMEANERFLEKLVNGYRMEQPSYSPKAVYKTMLKCWHQKPSNRPSFTELAKELGSMLDDNLRRHFEELNNPYVDMNVQRQPTSDYLSMMGSPNYRNLVSPTSDQREYVNSPNPSGSEYINAKSPTSPMSTNGSVFEFSPEDLQDSGYLRMSAKDSIFSPRQMGEHPFKFTPNSPNGNKKEEHPMKSMQSTSTDNYVNVGSSVSNPTYV